MQMTHRKEQLHKAHMSTGIDTHIAIKMTREVSGPSFTTPFTICEKKG